VRPEHADSAPSDASGWSMQVEVVEMLGAERLVYCRLGDKPFTVRLDATLPVPANGSTFTAAVEAQHLHWFDPQSQQRVG
jgi:sn-glycerol 3-phosphate transport system ATP-binding protein